MDFLVVLSLELRHRFVVVQVGRLIDLKAVVASVLFYLPPGAGPRTSAPSFIVMLTATKLYFDAPTLEVATGVDPTQS